MAEYLTPGVYVEEVEAGAKPIEGVSTSTAAFIGETERGPTQPRLVGGFEAFCRLYGGFSSTSHMPDAAYGFFANGGKRALLVRVCGKGAKAASSDLAESGGDSAETALSVSAIGPGEFGNRLAVKVEAASLSAVRSGLYKLTVIYFGATAPDPLVDPTNPANRRDPNRVEPDLVEVYDNLSADPSSTDFSEKRIGSVSALITVSATGGAIPAGSELSLLSGGSDGQSTKVGDFMGEGGAEPGDRTGLSALTEIDEISLVCAPDEASVNGLTEAIVEHCELLGDRFAVLQAPQAAGSITDITPPVDSSYAAFYYPWLKVVDPLTGREKLVPPGGHVSGIIARSDTERGVHKAPANETVRAAVGAQFPLTKADQAILNPRGVNCIRAFPARGLRLWGARTTSTDPSWRYVNVRRLFLYLEESIDEGTQWVVFEPNNQQLWARVRQSVGDFLTRVWRDGALMGTSPDQAFFVKCDETTMTPDDIQNGRLIVLVGVAPTRPAEFVVFRITQTSGGPDQTEE